MLISGELSYEARTLLSISNEIRNGQKNKNLIIHQIVVEKLQVVCKKMVTKFHTKTNNVSAVMT